MAVARGSVDPQGSVWKAGNHDLEHQVLEFSGDAKFLPVHVLRRDSGEEVSAFGGNGRMAGRFHSVHNIAIDSHGNLYTAEVDTGKRVQRFTPAP